MKSKSILLTFLFVCAASLLMAQGTWTQKADFGGTGRLGAFSFNIGSKGYIGTGYDGSYLNDFWEYDPASMYGLRKLTSQE